MAVQEAAGSQPQHAEPAAPAAGTGNHRAVLVVTCLALAAVVSAVASLNVALPSLARDTHATQTQLSWVIDAYALVFAALLLPAGALGDRFGRRRALLVGLTIFGAASIAAMCVSDANAVIGLRAVLGLGAAFVMPATLSTITSTFPPDQRTRAVGTWAGVAGASAILGLLVSGGLLEQWSWRSVFALNVALAAVAIIGTLRAVPESADADAPGIDAGGAVLAVVSLGALVYSIIEAPTKGWTSARTLVGLGIGVLVLALFVLWELGRRDPLLDPRLFRHRAFAAGTLSITIQFFAFFGFVFIVLQFLQLVRGDSAIVAAVSLIPTALSMMPMARGAAPRLAARIGQRPVCVAGLLLVAVGLFVLAQVDRGSSYWLILGGLVPLGAGMGLAMTPATSAVTDALPRDKQGVGSAMNDLSRELGGAFGIAVLGSVLQSVYRNNLTLPGLPAQEADKARESVAVAARLGHGAIGHAQSAFVDAMQAALLCASIVVAVTAVLVAVFLRRQRAATD